MISLQEITGMEGNVVTLQEIFSFQQTASNNGNKVEGAFVCRGIRPHFIDKLKTCGITVPNDIFDPMNVVEV